MRLIIFLIFGLIFSLPCYSEDIGLKVSAEKNWYSWGDYILGQDLKKGFEALGYSVKDTYQGSYDTPDTKIDVYMHGFVPFNPANDTHKTNVLYLYYPLETANMNKFINIEGAKEGDWYSLQTELWNFDVVAVGSPVYQKEIEKFGIKTIFTPQFTNPRKFFYEYDEDKAYDILFVGRPGYERISAKWAIESGFDVALYGEGWEDKEPEHYKGKYIPNSELHKYYASAKIVLNDTRKDMKTAGFISNRIFDVTASGGFVISDYMPQIEQFYGDSIPMFKNKEELKKLLNYYLSHPKERDIKAKKAREITLTHFTNEIIAQNILDAVKEIKPKKQVKDNHKLVLKFPWDSQSMQIGDYWLGLDLEAGLKEAGFDVKSYYYNDGFERDDFYNDADNLLYLQFKYNHLEFEDDNKARMMYFYFPVFIPNAHKFKNTQDTFVYNTDASLNNDLLYFDMIATPAKATLKELKKQGYNAEFVPQFTNPKKFYNAFEKDLQNDLLFVGSTWYERISALYAIELGYDVAIYGMGWQGKVPDRYIKGNFIDNNMLHQFYSSAKIVLSDHAEDLADMGLVVNRLYDASAVGAFIISEYSPYIEEIFGDSIPMFKDKAEFKALVDYYLSHPEERQKKAHEAQKITLKNYTNVLAGQKIKQLFSKIREDK